MASGINRRLRVPALLVFFFLFLAAPRAARAQTFDEILAAPALKNASVGIVVRDLETGETLYEKNRYRTFIPASNMKILTNATAMLLLGGEYRFRTEFYAAGREAQSGSVRTLFVQGYGDPTWSDRFFPSNEAAVNAIAGELVMQGLRRVDGDIILDDTFFPPEKSMPPGWQAEDFPYCYCPRPAPISVAANCLKVTAIGTRRGSAARIVTDPPLDATRIVNRTITGGRGGGISVSESANGDIVISGRVGAGRSVSNEHPVRNPALFYGNVLSGALRRAGVPVTGRILLYRKDGADLQSFSHFATVNSPLLGDVLGEMIRHSDNFIAEQVLRTIGGGRNGGTTRAGAALVARTMEQQRFAEPYILHVYDGSGLSRSDRVTPDILINVLSGLYHSTYRDVFLGTMAQPGGDGTMEKRLVGTPAAGRIWVKTGALRGACSLSGYYLRSNGHMAAFTMLFNNYSVHSNFIRAIQDKLVLAMLNM